LTTWKIGKITLLNSPETLRYGSSVSTSVIPFQQKYDVVISQTKGESISLAGTEEFSTYAAAEDWVQEMREMQQSSYYNPVYCTGEDTFTGFYTIGTFTPQLRGGTMVVKYTLSLTLIGNSSEFTWGKMVTSNQLPCEWNVVYPPVVALPVGATNCMYAEDSTRTGADGAMSMRMIGAHYNAHDHENVTGDPGADEDMAMCKHTGGSTCIQQTSDTYEDFNFDGPDSKLDGIYTLFVRGRCKTQNPSTVQYGAAASTNNACYEETEGVLFSTCHKLGVDARVDISQITSGGWRAGNTTAYGLGTNSVPRVETYHRDKDKWIVGLTFNIAAAIASMDIIQNAYILLYEYGGNSGGNALPVKIHLLDYMDNSGGAPSIITDGTGSLAKINKKSSTHVNAVIDGVKTSLTTKVIDVTHLVARAINQTNWTQADDIGFQIEPNLTLDVDLNTTDPYNTGGWTWVYSQTLAQDWVAITTGIRDFHRWKNYKSENLWYFYDDQNASYDPQLFITYLTPPCYWYGYFGPQKMEKVTLSRNDGTFELMNLGTGYISSNIDARIKLDDNSTDATDTDVVDLVPENPMEITYDCTDSDLGVVKTYDVT